MRPGRRQDLPAVLDLWGAEVRLGHRDCVPSEVRLRRQLADFDWAARSRMVDGRDGALAGAVMVMDRMGDGGAVARVEAAADENDGPLVHDLARWGIQLSQAAGARSAQVWLSHGRGGELAGLGLELIRPWWRMDHSLVDGLPEPSAPSGYEIRDARAVAAGAWASLQDRAFADHWRYVPRDEMELMSGRPPELSLMAVTAGRAEPAALTLCQLETYIHDLRPQPVGIVMSVGTLPEHRRCGLATWLVAEGMARLRDAGARHASLYVDARNHTRAYDVYRKLGFEVAFETEVWEATFK
jgi:ribosomal protein S18 acetylase RimI-like enzyme